MFRPINKLDAKKDSIQIWTIPITLLKPKTSSIDTKTSPAAAAKNSITIEKLATSLMNFVVTGNQKAAEQLLNDNAALATQLLTAKVSVADAAGRVFSEKKITAYQYALWALDRHMWKMLHSHFSTIDQAREQLLELEAQKISYRHAATDKLECKPEAHFDFNDLIESLETCISILKKPDPNNPDELENACFELRRAQAKVPMHIANEYCRADRSFKQDKNIFNEKDLPRILSDSTWFNRNATDNMAFCRGNQAAISNNIPALANIEMDLAAIKLLRDIRTNEYIEHQTQLVQLLKNSFRSI